VISHGTIENHVDVVHIFVLADKNSLPHLSFSQPNYPQLLFFFFLFSQNLFTVEGIIVPYPFTLHTNPTKQISAIPFSSTNPNFCFHLNQVFRDTFLLTTYVIFITVSELIGSQ